MHKFADFPLPPAMLPWLLSAQTAILWLHHSYLSISLWLLVALFIGWRWLIGRGRLSYPSKLGKVLTISIVLLVLSFEVRGFNLESAGTFLILTALLKLIELRTLRDGYILIFLNFYVLATGFLFAQDMLSALWAMLIISVLLTALIRMHYTSDSEVSNSALITTSAKLMLLSLPMMLVLYLLFPRFGPLWSFTLQSAQAKTGLSDTMAPADIAEMTQSAELAFRVSFDNDELPSRHQLYWRALVLDYYDGRQWTARQHSSTQWYKPNVEKIGLGYEIIQEPTGKNWLFALNTPYAAEPDTGVTSDQRLVAKKPVHQRQRYQVVSDLNESAEVKPLKELEKKRYLQLPANKNPQAVEWAEQLKALPPTEAASRIMQHFAVDDFYYTLKPQRYGEHEIDEFLFSRKQGFCAHYASAMTFIARSAGIPARVVTGYQGGEWNKDEHFLTVRQYDAHAWVELWFADIGWQTYDPTAMVAEDRILYGLEQAIAREGTFLQGQINLHKFKQVDWVNRLRVWSGTAEFMWQRWVLSYDQGRQSSFLQNVLKMKDYQQGLYIIAFSFVMFFVLASTWLWWRMRPAPLSPLVRAWQQLQRQGQRLGIDPQNGETMNQYLLRLQIQLPAMAANIGVLIEQVNAALYQPTANEQNQAALIEQVHQLTKQLKQVKSQHLQKNGQQNEPQQVINGNR